MVVVQNFRAGDADLFRTPDTAVLAGRLELTWWRCAVDCSSYCGLQKCSFSLSFLFLLFSLFIHKFSSVLSCLLSFYFIFSFGSFQIGLHNLANLSGMTYLFYVLRFLCKNSFAPKYSCMSVRGWRCCTGRERKREREKFRKGQRQRMCAELR